jgi:hypothetical protein
MLTRLALYTALGLVLSAVGATLDTWQFWSVVALFWASEHLTRQELWDQITEEVARMRAENNNKDTQ